MGFLDTSVVVLLNFVYVIMMTNGVLVEIIWFMLLHNVMDVDLQPISHCIIYKCIYFEIREWSIYQTKQ